MFTDVERMNANISGMRGRAKLDASGERVAMIYHYVMTMYSVPQLERASVELECRKAMDLANRLMRARGPAHARWTSLYDQFK